jgi:hypothetical protein
VLINGSNHNERTLFTDLQNLVGNPDTVASATAVVERLFGHRPAAERLSADRLCGRRHHRFGLATRAYAWQLNAPHAASSIPDPPLASTGRGDAPTCVGPRLSSTSSAPPRILNIRARSAAARNVGCFATGGFRSAHRPRACMILDLPEAARPTGDRGNMPVPDRTGRWGRASVSDGGLTSLPDGGPRRPTHVLAARAVKIQELTPPAV